MNYIAISSDPAYTQVCVVLWDMWFYLWKKYSFFNAEH